MFREFQNCEISSSPTRTRDSCMFKNRKKKISFSICSTLLSERERVFRAPSCPNCGGMGPVDKGVNAGQVGRV